MRRFQIFFSVSLLSMTAGVIACDKGDDEGATTDDVGDGDGDTTTDTGDGDGATATTTTGDSGGCFDQPPECAQLIECLGVILPSQDLADYDVDGSCWCGTEAEALECYDVCVSQLDAAITQNPTVGECHGRYCPIEELDAAQPYGPPPCTAPAVLMDSLPVAGSYCAPPCGGVAQACPEHTQTIAAGQCTWGGEPNLCALSCYVDPFVFASGTQCQCGAVCQPYGGADGDGNLRGICTFAD